MTYVEEITTSLINVLEHTARLQTYQFAGHVANVDFWIDEVRHAVKALDGYADRFEKLKWTQAEYEREHPHVIYMPFGEKRQGVDPLLKPNVSSSELQRLSRRLMRAIERFLKRALDEELIDITRFDDLSVRLMGGMATK